MKRLKLVIVAFLFSAEIFPGFGPTNAAAQSQGNYYQVTGDEFGHVPPEGFSDSQSNLLWNAYNSQSDSLLAKFFNNWRLETQIAKEPIPDTPIANATASLYYFLLSTDYQRTRYPYEYAVIQDQIDVTVPSSFLSSEDEYVLRNFHPQSSDPYHPIFIMLDNSHNQLTSDFLGDWSEAKAQVAQEFFGRYVPFGTDVDISGNQNNWAIIRNWYTFSFSSDLQEASVSDQTPSGEITFACEIGSDGNWHVVPVYSGPPAPPPLPPPIGSPVPPPYFPYQPQPITPVAGPIPSPKPVPTPRPRPIQPPEHNPSVPVNPARPVLPRPVSSPPTQPASPQTPNPRSRPAQHGGSSVPPAKYPVPIHNSTPSSPPIPVNRSRQPETTRHG